MNVDVRPADEALLDRWDDLVARSPQGTVFHRRAALEAQARHGDATLHPLVGFLGDEPVGLFPVFERRTGPFTIAFSPPPDLLVTYLGPALLTDESTSRGAAERRRTRFVEACLDWLESTLSPTYAHVRTGDRFRDLRPFQRRGCAPTVHYSYVVDLTPGAEAVMDRFSSDARRNVRNADEAAYTIEAGDQADLRTILEQVRSRYADQGLPYRVPPAFVVELAERLPGAVHPYVCRVDGEFVGGIVALEDAETIYRWQGGVRSDADCELPVNDLLDWHVMREGMARSRRRYDLVGANTPRINRYKAKFGPELAVFYGLTYGSAPARKLADVVKRVG